MMDLVKEERERRDKEETKKMLDAIHNQARDNYYLEKGKNYLKHCKKNKKKNTDKLLEFVVCSVLVILPTLFLMIALIIRY